MSKSVFQPKMIFNLDLWKQAKGICYSHKRKSEIQLSLVFNNIKVQLATSQKHLGSILDLKLDFNDYRDSKINKCNKVTGIMKRFSLTVSRRSLLTIYKYFFRPNTDQADINYDKPLNESFKRNIEVIQHKAALVITSTTWGTSRDKLYQELDLSSLADRR